MADRKKRRFSIHTVLWLVMFVAGFAAGFFVRDRQQHERVERAVEEALNRTQRAGEELGRGAKSAAGELKGDKATGE